MSYTHKRYDWSDIQAKYDSGKSTHELSAEIGISTASFHSAKKRGLFTPRSASDARKNAIKTGRVDLVSAWTSDRRKAQSDAKKKLYAEHPEKHPNRKLANNRVNMSYPERLVFDHLTNVGIAFEHSKKIDKYFVDFCIGSLVIEVDGAAFHDAEYDSARDLVITGLGFVVKRFDAKAILKFGPSIVLDDKSDPLMYKNIELRTPHTCPVCTATYYGKRKFCSDECKRIARKQHVQASPGSGENRVTNRPDAETLITLMETESFVSIGKRFGVSDNSVRKWCKAYGIDTKRRAELSDDDVRVMIESGSGVTSIANHFGVTRERIKGIADRLGVELTDHTAVEYAPELVSKVADLIKQGYRNVDIIPLVGLTQKQISAIRCRIDR